jgi:hypothetical protein
VDAPPPSEQEADGRAVWEDTTEKREASLRERKAQMILAARQCVQLPSFVRCKLTRFTLSTKATVSCTTETGGHFINITASFISFLLASYLPFWIVIVRVLASDGIHALLPSYHSS